MLVEAVKVGVEPDPELEVEESVEPAINVLIKSTNSEISRAD